MSRKTKSGEKENRFVSLSTSDVAEAFGMTQVAVYRWKEEGCPVTFKGKIAKWDLREVIKWRMAKIKKPEKVEPPADAENNKDYIRQGLMRIFLNESGIARVQAAKLLREIDAEGGGPGEQMPKMVAFIEIENANRVIQATGNVTVRCPKCKETIRFKPV